MNLPWKFPSGPVRAPEPDQSSRPGGFVVARIRPGTCDLQDLTSASLHDDVDTARAEAAKWTAESSGVRRFAVCRVVPLESYGWSDPGAVHSRLYVAGKEDVPRLLAAVEAVLAQHECQAGIFPPTCTSCAAWDEAAEEVVEAFWPCPTYQAISRELLGGAS